MHWKPHSSTCANVKDRCTCMSCSVGHQSIHAKALPKQCNGRRGNSCMRRFGEQYFFQGGTPFLEWVCREIIKRSVRMNPSYILEVAFMIAVLTDLLEFFTIIKAQLHLKIPQYMYMHCVCDMRSGSLTFVCACIYRLFIRSFVCSIVCTTSRTRFPPSPVSLPPLCSFFPLQFVPPHPVRLAVFLTGYGQVNASI